MSTTTATTTYPYSYTTFSNASPASFSTPKAMPSMFPWGAIPSAACSAPSGAPSASPDGPIELPNSSSGSCAISNVASVNDHSFYDMYDCCKGGKMSTIGTPLPCTAVCYPSDSQSFLELGECLSKRTKIVVCSPPKAERGEPKSVSESSSASASASSKGSSSTGSSSAAASKTPQVSGVTGQATSTPTPTAEKGAANALAGGHSAVSKAGLAVFGLLAFTSAVGMLL